MLNQLPGVRVAFDAEALDQSDLEARWLREGMARRRAHRDDTH
jgi:hypothetical protein